jgi:signal transduction histidine kinase
MRRKFVSNYLTTGMDSKLKTVMMASVTGMRERAEEMGGKLNIVSSPGRGTTITATLSFDKSSTA